VVMFYNHGVVQAVIGIYAQRSSISSIDEFFSRCWFGIEVS